MTNWRALATKALEHLPESSVYAGDDGPGGPVDTARAIRTALDAPVSPDVGALRYRKEDFDAAVAYVKAKNPTVEDPAAALMETMRHVRNRRTTWARMGGFVVTVGDDNWIDIGVFPRFDDSDDAPWTEVALDDEPTP